MTSGTQWVFRPIRSGELTPGSAFKYHMKKYTEDILHLIGTLALTGFITSTRARECRADSPSNKAFRNNRP